MAATSGNKACVLKLSRVAWRKQLRHKCVFQCGGKKCLLRAPCKPDEVKDVARRMRNVAEHVIDRVDNDFPETDLRIAMQCFDIAKVRVGMADGGEAAIGADYNITALHCISGNSIES